MHKVLIISITCLLLSQCNSESKGPSEQDCPSIIGNDSVPNLLFLNFHENFNRHQYDSVFDRNVKDGTLFKDSLAYFKINFPPDSTQSFYEKYESLSFEPIFSGCYLSGIVMKLQNNAHVIKTAHNKTIPALSERNAKQIIDLLIRKYHSPKLESDSSNLTHEINLTWELGSKVIVVTEIFEIQPIDPFIDNFLNSLTKRKTKSKESKQPKYFESLSYFDIKYLTKKYLINNKEEYQKYLDSIKSNSQRNYEKSLKQL